MVSGVIDPTRKVMDSVNRRASRSGSGTGQVSGVCKVSSTSSLIPFRLAKTVCEASQ
jgi:hypothetical protein